MIENYLITYEKRKFDGYYIETTVHQIQIPAHTLFDAIDYAHNTLELQGIKEVVKL